MSVPGYLSQFLEVKTLGRNDPNFVAEYQLFIEQSQEAIIRKLAELKEKIAQNTMPQGKRI